ncbi:MAG: Mur ligase family protein [Patescibacteria group bacterium]
MEIDFKKYKKIHFLGIGGIGISAIARMFLLEGKKVTGSDLALSEVTDELVKLGVFVTEGQDIKTIPKDSDLIVYSPALSEYAKDFLAKVKGFGIPMLSYPEVLHQISKEKYTIAVSGTHGKTTTTAMIAKVMADAKLDPTVIVGSLLKDTKSNFVAGKSEYFVVEACEYRRSFLQLQPTILVITNIDADHLDYYKDLDDVVRAFGELVAQVPKDGFVICNPSLPEIKSAIAKAVCQIVDYTKFQKRLKLKIPGKHNLENAAAALAVGNILGLKGEVPEKSLEDFSGTWRRFEYRGKTTHGASVYDDYGHHPTEITATLQGARELFPTQKIVVVFQPHLYSRTKDHLSEWATCFKLADHVVVLPIYPAREVDPGDITSEMVVEELDQSGQLAHLVKTFAEAAERASDLTVSGDVIITMGAGETNKVADLLV